MSDTFHTIVIGAGSGGLTVAVGLANLGKPVAVIEALHVGGDCTNVGCVPSKTLIHQAEQRGATDATGALAEVRRKRDALRDKETHEFGEVPNLSLIFGLGRPTSRRQVVVALPRGRRAGVQRTELMTQTDRGYTDDLQQGFIIVDALRLTGKILAATIVGPRASEMISLFTLAIQEQISLYKLYRIVYPYPTFSSGIQKVADAFLRETLSGLRSELATYLRYRWAQPQAAMSGRPAGRPAAPQW